MAYSTIISTNNTRDRAMVRAISRWLFTSEVPASIPVSPCAICGGYSDIVTGFSQSVVKKNQLDVTFCILYFSSNSCSTCFGQPCAHHQEQTTA